MDVILRKGVYWHIGLILWYLLSLANYFYPVLRFKSVVANHIYISLVLLMPVMILFIGFFYKRLVIKIINTSIFIIPCLVGLPLSLILLSLLSVDIFSGNVGRGFEPIDQLGFASYNITAYRTNGGAATGFGIVVRQEKEVFFGVLLVKKIYSEYHTDNVSLIKTDEKTIKINGVKHEVKKYVYFQ